MKIKNNNHTLNCTNILFHNNIGHKKYRLSFKIAKFSLASHPHRGFKLIKPHSIFIQLTVKMGKCDFWSTWYSIFYRSLWVTHYDWFLNFGTAILCYLNLLFFTNFLFWKWLLFCSFAHCWFHISKLIVVHFHLSYISAVGTVKYILLSSAISIAEWLLFL